jgi:hypothetical protein
MYQLGKLETLALIFGVKASLFSRMSLTTVFEGFIGTPFFLK